MLVVAVVAPACRLFDTPDFSGEVMDTSGPDEVLVRFDEEHKDLGDDARVWLGDIDGQKPEQGDHVSVWISGGVDTSDPPGVSATRLRIETASD